MGLQVVALEIHTLQRLDRVVLADTAVDMTNAGLEDRHGAFGLDVSVLGESLWIGIHLCSADSTIRKLSVKVSEGVSDLGEICEQCGGTGVDIAHSSSPLDGKAFLVVEWDETAVLVCIWRDTSLVLEVDRDASIFMPIGVCNGGGVVGLDELFGI